MNLHVLMGDEVLALMDRADFARSWGLVYDQCPWATGFQSFEFVRTWYRSYAGIYTPLVVIGPTAEKMEGLLPLALKLDHPQVAYGAGAHQAEYQGWLCAPDKAQEFPGEAIEKLRALNIEVHWKYLPPQIPLEWIGKDKSLASRAILTAHPCPLMELQSGQTVAESLKKSANKSKLSRLQKLGELQFKRLSRPEELAPFLEEIIAAGDLRQGAIHNVLPFQADPRKRDFHLNLLAAGERLHVTVLLAGGRLVASHIGMISRDRVHLGIQTYAPELAALSPGKIHLLMLANKLREEGYRYLDLTPGGDAYKDRFDNQVVDAYGLSVLGSSLKKPRVCLRDRLSFAAGKILARGGMPPARLRKISGRLGRIRPRTLLNLMGRVCRGFYHKTEFRVYFYDCQRKLDPGPNRNIKRNHYADICKFVPAEAWQSRKGFLSGSLEALGQQGHIFTVADGTELLHFGWLRENATRSYFTEVHQDYEFPEGSAVLFRSYTHPHARGRGGGRLFVTGAGGPPTRTPGGAACTRRPCGRRWRMPAARRGLTGCTPESTPPITLQNMLWKSWALFMNVPCMNK